MNWGILILIIPFISFVILILSGKKIKGLKAGLLGTFSIALSFIFSLFLLWRYIPYQGEQIIIFEFPWLSFSKNLSIQMGMLIDSLSVMMIGVVCFISFMVHLYSIYYLKGEDRYTSYFAYLSLFTFSMLGLVVAVNIFQMYIFWELVGVSSFLLIGFYFQRTTAVAAAKKAFIVTRFADLGFLIGILILGTEAQTFNIPELIQKLTLPERNLSKEYLISGWSVISIAMLLIFMGGAGKSAMFPLHIWLPDAMEGPTPVSALIHAATMVVAGVYLIARLFPIYFVVTPDILQIVTWIGILSALLSAIIACTQTDIKRILAYSTISQIGYMMFAMGITTFSKGDTLGYSASLFHLFTHAFFKALLFLAAGIIIHAVHSNEVNEMGGLRKSLPITHITFLLATLAISGIPPLSGFYSKEAILAASHHSQYTLFWLALLGSSLTTFYMFRLYFLIFWNKPTTHSHHHEPTLLILPVIILAIGTVFNGFIPFYSFISVPSDKVINFKIQLSQVILPVLGSVIAMMLAGWFYLKPSIYPKILSSKVKLLYITAYRKFYFDEIYIFITKKIIFYLIGRPIAWFDRKVVDGMMNGMATLSTAISYSIKGIQSGNLQSYTLYIMGGLLAIVGMIIYVFI